MFANLKNKLIEEVKASPSKFQQLANAAQAAVSSTTTTPAGSESGSTATNENFFSITEEDTPQNSPYKPLRLPPGAVRGRSTTPHALNNGAIPRTRRLSNSSMASDVSFRLPSYDSPAVYHLHSDLDESGSEMGDTASTAAKLDVITKEQLYDAYKKSLDRYHKYRCRYTDLAKKYKDLEHDSTKARSVLVETQEKAIRRISELREQCTLEQQAKAHLEEALRIEMDDMQCKMQAYQTKLTLLGENPENITAALAATLHQNDESQSLIDLDNQITDTVAAIGSVTNNSLIENVVGVTTTSDKEALLQLEQLNKQLHQREQQLRELQEKMDKSTATIEILRKQEEENALLLAQTKQAIHSELENKESDVRKLTDANKQLQLDLQAATAKENHLSEQLSELKELKEKLKKALASKQEVDAKVIATEHMLSTLKEQYSFKDKSLVTAEEKLVVQTKESDLKVQDLRQQNAQLSEMVQRYQQNEVSLAEIDNELNRTKNENDNLRATMAENARNLQELEDLLNTQRDLMENSKQERIAADETLSEERTKMEELLKQLEDEKAAQEQQKQKHQQLETELRILNEQNESNESETIAALKDELHKVNAELMAQLSAVKEKLANKEKELKSLANKLTKHKKQHENGQSKISQQSEEIEKLKSERSKHEQNLLSLQSDVGKREAQTEIEKNELKTQVSNILHEISQMEEQMRIVQQSHAQLEAEKHRLEVNIENMQKEMEDANAGNQRWRDQLSDAEEQLHLLELKLQNVESENSQLAEKNCLLEESSNRLEKLRAERERQQTAEEANASEMLVKLETAENAILKLNEKMSQVLDENSRMHNAQELHDHDHRTLQDKCDTLEKEKLLAQDTQKCQEEELKQLKANMQTELEKMQQLQQTAEQLQNEKRNTEQLTTQLGELQSIRVKLEHELNDMKVSQSDDEKLGNLLQQKQNQIQELQSELAQLVHSQQRQTEESAAEIKALQEQVSTLVHHAEQLERTKETMELFKTQIDSLNQELSAANEKIAENSQQYETKIQQKAVETSECLLAIKQQLSEERETAQELKLQLQQNNELLNAKQQEFQQLETEVSSATNVQEELVKLREIEQNLSAQLAVSKEKYALQISELEAKLSIANADVEKLHESNDACQVKIEKLESKHQLQLGELESSLQQLRAEHLETQLQAQKTANNLDKLSNYEQMLLENEYLTKHVKQLESEMQAQKQLTHDNSKDTNELKDKLKSLQCEMYVHQENAEKHDAQLVEKQKETNQKSAELELLNEQLVNERAELMRQKEHAAYITQQNDVIQKDLLHAQQQLTDTTQKLQGTSIELEQLKTTTINDSVAKEKHMQAMNDENERNRQTIETLTKEVNEITAELQAQELLQEQLDALKIELEERCSAERKSALQTETSSKTATLPSDAENLRTLNESLQCELEDLKYKSTSEISTLQQEIEDMQTNATHMTDRIMELEKIRAAWQVQQLLLAGAAPVSSNVVGSDDDEIDENLALQTEKTELEAKLKVIMNEVQDVSNRNLFLEQKCENFLILEQSNERLKLQNAKLSRQLDETLVSMQHNESITANTEFEYLKNIMFQYLTGTSNGNNETLVKVISAVLKFSPQQTQVALEKENQRRSLINKIL